VTALGRIGGDGDHNRPEFSARGRRVHAGLKRAVAKGVKLGRPAVKPQMVDKIRRELSKGLGINKVTKLVGSSNGVVARIKGEL
jgi:DNA invertase Pin-like site-specific DNA recombinase